MRDFKKFRIGDRVTPNRHFPGNKIRRQVGKIVGYSYKYPWCVRVKWIKGIPKPIKNVETIAEFYLRLV